MKKSASIDYAKIQINTQKTTATATTTTTTTTVTKKLIFKSRQTATASGNDEETKKIFTSDSSNTETAPTTKKFALKRLQKCDSEGAESKKPRGATIEFTDSDVDDDVTVFEMINTEKARLAKEARNGSDFKAPVVETKKNDVTAKKKTNGKVVRSASIKEEAGVVEKAVEKVAEPIPAKVITNGRKNSSNSAAENNGHVNGTKATVNKKILLKRSSKNESYSEEDEIQSPLETTKKPEKVNLKTSPPPPTSNNNVNHEEENRKSGGGKNSKIKLKITDSDVEDPPIDVKTTPPPTAKTRRSSTGSNKSSPTPAKKSPKQKQLLDETKLSLNETIISGTCGSMQFGLVKESTTTSLVSSVVTKADSSGCGSESLFSNTSATLVMPRINRSDDDDDDDDLDDKQNVKKFKLNIKRDLNAAAKSPPVAQTTTTTTNAIVIKNRIFNSKQSQNPSQNVAAKSSKISGFKIVFNEDDDENSNDLDEEEITRENKINSNEIDHKSSKSSHKHEQQHSSNHQSSQRNNMGTSAASSSSSKNATEEIHLRNPRRAFECEELGEAQAFLDDLNYLIGGLGSSHRLSERCLSLVKLAEQCLSSEFRMSLRSSLLPGSSNADNTSVYYLNKLFDLLSDATKYKSLSLCTCLIIYELTQDKLSVEIDQSLFNLVLEIVNEFTSSSSSGESSDEEFITTHLNDIPLSTVSTKASRSSSGCSSMTSSPSNPLHQRHQSAHIGELDGDETDDLIVYKKVSAKCRKLFEKISPLFSAASASLNQTTTPSPPHSVIAGAHNQVEINFCTSLLSLDCLLNLNKNTRNLLFLNETYKAQLRETRVIEKLITRVRFISELMHSSANLVDPLVYAIDRYIQCLSLLQTITQAPQQSAQQQQQHQPKKKLLSICYDSDSPTPEFVLNQNYLIEFRDGFFVDILKKTLETCCEQLIIQNQKKTSRATNRAGKTPSPPPPTSDDQPSKSNLYAMLTNLVKDVYLLLINTTHNNEANCEKLASDKELLDISIKLMLLDSIGDATCHIADEMKFDVQIMILGFLINLFVNSLQKKSVVSLVNYKNKKLNMSLLDAILKIYLAKEALVQLAEDDHQNELEKINEQIESQNVENINAAIMNSIHRAGKHMEDHIIAAHAALIIGYLLINDRYFNQDQRRFKVESIRDKIKDRSFQVMAQIIRKFVVFMNIMKVGGFSADEHIEIILKHLDEFDIE